MKYKGWILRVVNSCETIDQLETAYNWARRILIEEQDVKDLNYSHKKMQFKIMERL